MKQIILTLLIALLFTSCTIAPSKNVVPSSSSLTVADLYSYEGNNTGIFNYEALSQITGIDIEYRDYSTSEAATKVLAGDSDVDIYMLDATSARLLIDKGAYIPIESETVSEYVVDCLDCLSELCYDSAGNLILMPVFYNVSAVIAPKSAVDELKITYSQIEYVEDYLNYVSSYIGSRECYGNPYFIWENVEQQYDMNFNDFANNQFDYNTDLYKKMFSLLLGGWEHTYDGNWYTKGLRYDKYSKDNTLFVTYSLPAYSKECPMFWDEWRAFPMPKINNDVKSDYAFACFAYINPNSKNAYAACKVLEAIAENYFTVLGPNGRCSLIFKDYSRYPSNIKTDSEVFADFLNISEKSTVYTYRFPESTIPDIIAYKNGEMTLDQLISEHSRQVEVWLNE